MIVVTGGTGLVGSHLIYELIKNGKQVTALIRPNTSRAKFTNSIKFYTNNAHEIAQKVNWVEGDLNSISDLKELINTGDRIYHCAAKVSFNPKDDLTTIETNVEGTANLVNVCLDKKVEKLCHVSSIGALGSKLNGQQINEETPWSATGKSAYSLSKYYSELEVWRGIAEGLNAVVVNPSVILGPGNWNAGSPKLFSLVAKGLKFYTKGSTGYVDVRDVVKAMILLMEAEISEERYLLSSENLSYQKLFNDIAVSINANPPLIYANSFMTLMAYKLMSLKCFLTRSEPTITKQTHKISHTKDQYSGIKISNSFNFEYTPISKTIEFIGKCYLKNN